MKDIQLRSLTDEDIPVLTNWLNKDYIKKWYHEPEDWLVEIKGRNEEFNWINHFIVTCNGHPIGFCQYYDCFDAKELEDWYTVNTLGDKFSIDYLIGEEDYLGQGYGKQIVKKITEMIFINENVNVIVVQPDEENFASNNALLSNNYIFDKEKRYYYKTSLM